MPTAIDFYFDFISPFGYLASTKIEKIAARHNRSVAWRPFLQGVSVVQIMGLKPLMETPLKADYMIIDRPRMAKLLGVPLKIPDLDGVNSVAASRAFYWLADRDPAAATAFAKAVFRSLWVDGGEITTPNDIVAIASAIGIDGPALGAALEDQDVKDRLRREVDAAIGRKVFGSPFFIIDEQPIWGVDRLWMIEHWLVHGTWESPDEKCPT